MIRRERCRSVRAFGALASGPFNPRPIARRRSDPRLVWLRTNPLVRPVLWRERGTAADRTGNSANELSCPLAAPDPMKMESAWVILGGPALGVRPFCVWCVQPGNEPGPDLGSTSRRTRPCRPRPRGSTKSKLLHASRSAHRAGRSTTYQERPPWTSFMTCCAGLDVHKKTVVACVRRVDPDGAVRRAGPHLRHHDRRPAGPGRLARRRRASATSPWNRPASTGSRSSTSWRAASRCSWSTPSTSSRSPAARPTSRTPSGSPSCSSTACSRASFIPPPPIRELRDLTRQRTQLIREKAAVANRIQKVLEDANIKLASVATDVLGVSGRAMIRGPDRRPRRPGRLAELARRQPAAARSPSCGRRCRAGSPSTTASCCGR